jgi:hypothetical protein
MQGQLGFVILELFCCFGAILEVMGDVWAAKMGMLWTWK